MYRKERKRKDKRKNTFKHRYFSTILLFPKHHVQGCPGVGSRWSPAGGSGECGDPCSTQALRSSVFEGRLPRNVGPVGEWDDVLKGSKVSFCETGVIFDLLHDDQFSWQAQYFRWLRLFLRGRFFRDLDEKAPET
jgi:hypothetical protein